MRSTQYYPTFPRLITLSPVNPITGSLSVFSAYVVWMSPNRALPIKIWTIAINKVFSKVCPGWQCSAVVKLVDSKFLKKFASLNNIATIKTEGIQSTIFWTKPWDHNFCQHLDVNVWFWKRLHQVSTNQVKKLKWISTRISRECYSTQGV